VRAAQEAAAGVVASLQTARGLTESSLEAMRASAGPNPPAAVHTLQRFLDDVNRVLLLAEDGTDTSDMLGAVAQSAAPTGAADDAVEARVGDVGDGQSQPLPEPQAPSAPSDAAEVPAQLPATPPADQAAAAADTAQECVSLELGLPTEAPEASQSVSHAPTVEQPPHPPQPLPLPLPPRLQVDVRRRSQSPSDSFGSPFAPSEAAPHVEPPAPPAASRLHPGSPLRSPRVLVVPTAQAPQPATATAQPEATVPCDGEAQRGRAPQGWVGNAMNTLFGVVAVPERKGEPKSTHMQGRVMLPSPPPPPTAAGEQPAGALLAVPAECEEAACAPARPLAHSRSTPSLFLADVAAAVAAAPPTPPGLESPAPQPRARAVASHAESLPSAAAVREPSSPSEGHPPPDSRPPPSPPQPPRPTQRGTPRAAPPVSASDFFAAGASASGLGAQQQQLEGAARPPLGADPGAVADAAVAAAVAKLLASRGAGVAQPSPLSPARANAQQAQTPAPSSPAATAQAVAARRRAAAAGAQQAERGELMAFAAPSPVPGLPAASAPALVARSRIGKPGGASAALLQRAGAASLAAGGNSWATGDEADPRLAARQRRESALAAHAVEASAVESRHEEREVAEAPAGAEQPWSWSLDSLAAAFTGGFASPGDQPESESVPPEGEAQGWSLSSLLGGASTAEDEAGPLLRRSRAQFSASGRLDDEDDGGTQRSWSTRLC